MHAGPVRPEDHYAIPPLARGSADEVLKLIRDKQYFVLHAPRQTGKTSALIALRDLLNGGEAGDFRCVNVNVEVGQVARDDTERGLQAIIGSLATTAMLLGDDYPDRVWSDILERFGPEAAFKELLTRWCLANPTPLSSGPRWRKVCAMRRTVAASAAASSVRKTPVTPHMVKHPAAPTIHWSAWRRAGAPRTGTPSKPRTIARTRQPAFRCQSSAAWRTASMAWR